MYWFLTTSCYFVLTLVIFLIGLASYPSRVRLALAKCVFVSIDHHGELLPQYAICMKTLSKENTKKLAPAHSGVVRGGAGGRPARVSPFWGDTIYYDVKP